VAEFEELQIKITLIDDAATGVKLLNTTIAGIGNTVGKQVTPQLTAAARGIAQVSQETKTLQTRIRSAIGDFSNLTATIIGIGQGIGLIGRMPLALGGLIGIIAGINAALVQFSQRMLDLRGKAQAAGLVPDQFMNISLQLQKFGASAEQAESDIISFHRTVREANKGGTAEFNRIFSEARDPENVVRFANYLQELINSGQSEKAISLVAERARKIFDRELKRTGGSRAEATRQAEAFLGLFGLTMRAMQVEELAPFDSSTKWQERIDLAAKFWVEWTKVLKVLDDILSGVQKELLPSFTELNKALAGLGVGWGETIGASIATTLREIKAMLAGINWLLGRGESSGGGLPGMFGGGGGGGGGGTQQQWDPRAPYRREGTTAPSLGQQAPGAATPGPGLGVPGFGIPFGSSPPPAAPGGDVFSDRFGIWPGGGGKPRGSDVGPGYGAGAFGVSSGGALSGGDFYQAGKFRAGGRGRFTPGGIPLAPIYRGSRDFSLPPAPEKEPGLGAAGVGRFGGGFLGQAAKADTWQQRIEEATRGRSYSEKENVPAPSVWEGGKLPRPGDIEQKQREMHERLWERYEERQLFGQPRGELPSPKELAPWSRYSGVEPTSPISLDRGVLDRSMGAPLAGPQRVEGSGNVDVTITDRGSKVEADGGGMFEGNVETTKERVMGI
jgi:hypothetical protein